MKKNLIPSLILLWALAGLTGCGKETETITVEPASNYLLLQPGKYITYRLDSTVYTNAGRKVEVHSYQEKNLVEESFKDASGRTSYRISRMLRNADGTGSWKVAGTNYISLDSNRIELVENNLRFVKLVTPVKMAATWKGNGYLPDEPYKSSYNYVTSIADWRYSYDTVGQLAIINGKTFNDVISIKGIDESRNLPIVDTTVIATRSLFKEKYAKGLGLIYQEYILYEYQGTAGKYYVGFGVKRSIVDNN